jgi:hypothetical protein
MIALEISRRNARVAAIPKCWDRLRAGLDLILERGADTADLPGGASGGAVPLVQGVGGALGQQSGKEVGEAAYVRNRRPVSL